MPDQESHTTNSGQSGARSLSIEQATQARRVTRRTLHDWTKRGRLQTVRTSPGSPRVRVASVR